MSIIPGAIPVTGFLGPTDSNDTYAVTDAIYGVDGYRSVSAITARNSITLERRREGMLVYTQNDNNVWQLLDGPWDFSDSDWRLFISSSATQSLTATTSFLSLSGGSVSGDTTFYSGVTASTLTLSTTSLAPINIPVFFTDPSPLINGDLWATSGISGVFLNLRVGGVTKSVELS